ncbi:MAG TPA: GNAT family N-acetyltransferase [Clostridiaceae bacterium]
MKLNKINTADLSELALVMLDSFKGSCEDAGESIDDIIEELYSVISGSFAPFISDASYQIKQNGEILSAIMINYYEGSPLISEIFTKKQYRNLGMAGEIIKQSINSLLLVGHNELTLFVDPRNSLAIRLYEKSGFKFVSEKELAKRKK